MQVTFNDDNTVTMSQDDFIKHFKSKFIEIEVPAKPTSENNLKVEVTRLLDRCEISKGILGYEYIRESVLLGLKDITIVRSICSKLYPAIAAKFDTLPTRAERAIRHAIESTYLKNGAVIDLLIGTTYVSNGKPTNSEFLMAVIDKIKLMA